MSSAGSSYWRRSGLTYLKYANVAAECVRNALKEPARATAKIRETVYFRQTQWKDGKPEKTVITDITEALKAATAKK
jgi:hypothetical protein